MPFKIFVSYSTDDLPLVDKIRSTLGRQYGIGVDVYVAEYSAPAGVRLDEEIKRHLVTCDLFCVLWSRNAKESGWVQQEIGVAEGRGRLIVPIVLDANLPLPGFIQDRKYIPAYRGIEGAIQNLNEIVAANVNRANLAIRGQKQQQSNAFALLGLGVLLLMVLTSKD
jgi:hypothetical protein